MLATLYMGGKLHLNEAMQLTATPVSHPATLALGQVLRVHAARATLLIHKRILAVLCALGAVVLLIAAVWRWYDAYLNYGPALVERWTSPLLILAAVFMVFFILLLIDLHTLRNTHAAICSDGLHLQQGRKNVDIQWEHIEGLFLRSYRYLIPFARRPHPVRVTLHVAGHKPIKLASSLENLAALTDTIKQRCYPLLLEQYRTLLQQGKALNFGPITISPEALQLRRKTIAWASICAASIEHGRVRLTLGTNTKRRTIHIASHAIPNVDLCMQVIHHLGEVS